MPPRVSPPTKISRKICKAMVHPSSQSQIRLLDVVIGQEVGALALPDNAARLQHIGAVGQLQGPVNLLLHQEDGEALRLQRSDLVVELVNDQGCQSEGWLVQHEELRVRHQRPAYGQHL